MPAQSIPSPAPQFKPSPPRPQFRRFIPTPAPQFRRFWPHICDAIRLIIAYIDTISVFFNYKSLPPRCLQRVRAVNGPDPDRKRVSIKTCKNPNGYVWGYRLAVQQPTVAAMMLLSQWQRQHNGKVSWLQVAYDFCTARKDEAERLGDHFRQHTALKRQRGRWHQIGRRAARLF
jgi:hypothetical protein